MKPWTHVCLNKVNCYIPQLLSIWVYGGTAFGTCFKIHHFQFLFFQPIFLSFMEMRAGIFLTFGEKWFKSGVKFVSHTFLRSAFFQFICQISQVPPLQLPQWWYLLYGVRVPWCWSGGLQERTGRGCPEPDTASSSRLRPARRRALLRPAEKVVAPQGKRI